jgi:CRP/FNR family transcriptional regulator
MEKLRQHIEAITSLTDQEFEHVKTFFTVKKVRKHQYLVQEGDPVKYEYVIMKGIFRVFHLDETGKEHIVQFATENWWMTDYISYFNQQPANLHVLCMEEGEVLCLTLPGREKLSGNPQQRYRDFALLYPDLMQKVPKKYIAEYLGVSRETLSRLYSSSK